MLAIKYFIIDENKIHAQIQENKKKPKKESRFQRKMKEMMEQAEAAAKIKRKTIKLKIRHCRIFLCFMQLSAIDYVTNKL